MIDATGLELIARSVREAVGGGTVRETIHAHGQATLDVAPEAVRDVLAFLRDDAEEPFDFLASLHGCDYFPAEPRLAVHYQLLSTERRERLGVRTRMTVEAAEAGTLPTVTDLWATADFQEKETFDFFGVRFDGHEDLRRLHMPEDYEGHPQRRDFPIGGEPVLYTFNEHTTPRWYE
ncbi:MAG: NADH-ubiquinone oxidoreductase chain C [uncultured Solirubrobacterales bacterium]|uniref:NADH-quinone oxidoreductase subunit C n=1 Tax=uncultured Solirubrobacterales bacterium TaxID=768556 RepID=A0A6J4SGN9_9ACTN|nr:MAG: NADH-ubiquinone oxidoreductase chain C [uncultured Solirubrobacterales bacterium]